MIYYFDWKIVFNTAGRVDDVLQWLNQESVKATALGNFIGKIITQANIDKTDDILELWDNRWELEKEWDHFIKAIKKSWNNDEEIDFAYAVVGKDIGTRELESGKYTIANIDSNNKIDLFRATFVPKTNKATTTIAAKTTDTTKPLRCTCGAFVGLHSDWCDLVTRKHSDGAY